MASGLLTDEIIATIEPRSKPFKVSIARAMHLHVAPSGAKSFRYKYRSAGKEQLLTIGRFPAVDIAEARRRLEVSRQYVALRSSPPIWTERPTPKPKTLETMPVPDGYLIYFILAHSRYVKIGVTTDLPKRLLDLQAANPEPLTVLATMPGGFEHEGFLHSRFIDQRRQGEWFTLSAELRSFIRYVKETGLWPS